MKTLICQPEHRRPRLISELTRNKLNHLMWISCHNQSDHMNIYHFTDTKDIWHVSSPKATNDYPASSIISLTFYTFAWLTSVSGFTDTLSKNQEKSELLKGMIWLVHCVRKKQEGWHPTPSPILNESSSFQLKGRREMSLPDNSSCCTRLFSIVSF